MSDKEYIRSLLDRLFSFIAKLIETALNEFLKNLSVKGSIKGFDVSYGVGS